MESQLQSNRFLALSLGALTLSAAAAQTAMAAGSTAEQVLHIELSSPFGEAHFEAAIADVADFIGRTYRIVPDGEEGGFVDVEAELANLLR